MCHKYLRIEGRRHPVRVKLKRDCYKLLLCVRNGSNGKIWSSEVDVCSDTDVPDGADCRRCGGE